MKELYTFASGDLILGILAAVLVTAVSALLGFMLHAIMQKRGYRQNQVAEVFLSSAIGLALFLRFGFSVAFLQGLFLFFVLLYASLSDLTGHEVDDHVWVTVLALALVGIPNVGLSSMTAGAALVMLPQLALAILPPHKTVGGADMKLSAALAFLLGLSRGISAYMLGLSVAIVFMSIYNRRHKRCPKKPFALIPFLSMAAMLLFFV